MDMTSTTAQRRSIVRFGAAFAALALAACNQNTSPPAPIDLTKLTAVETNDIGKTPDLQQIAMTAGKDLYEKNCASCHGALETGVGRISPLASVLPRDTLAEHCDDDLAIVGYTDRQAYIRAIMTEKTRHGSFLGYAGVMPPFANEALSDAEMRDLASLFRCP